MQALCSGKIPEAGEESGDQNREGRKANIGLYHWLVTEDAYALTIQLTTYPWIGGSTGIPIPQLLPRIAHGCTFVSTRQVLLGEPHQGPQ